MSDLNIQLLDTGDNFILVSADTTTEIEYGQLAVCLVNTDYNDMFNLISDFLQSNRILRLAMDLQNSNKDELNTGTIKPEIINLIIRSLYQPISEQLAEEYLTKEQSVIISLLLIADIRSRIEGTKIDLSKTDYYIPLIFSDKKLHQHVRDILLQQKFAYSSPLQDKMNKVQLTSSIIVTEQGQPYQSYTITDIFDYLILDLQKYLIGKKKVNECQCCQKLFIPKYRSSEKFCTFNNSACKEKMKRTPNDQFIECRTQFRGYQSGRIHNYSTEEQYSSDFLNTLYTKWSKECGEKYTYYKGKDDLQGYKDWFKTTKFTAETLKEEWEKYQKEQEN